MQWNIRKIVMIVIKYSQMNQISALNKQQGLDILSNKTNKQINSENLSNWHHYILRFITKVPRN